MFAKAFLMVGANILDIETLPFYFPAKALVLTIGSFFALFLMISLLTLLLIRSNRIIELLKGNQKPRKEPKANLWLALLGGGSLTAGYYLTVYIWDHPSLIKGYLFPVAGLVTIGTYFLFTQLSVIIIRFLRKRRSLYWSGTRILWLSDLTYRMKDNARMFFLVTIVSTVAFSATGVLLGYMQMLDEMKNQSPYQVDYFPFPDQEDKEIKTQISLIENELQKADVSYQKVAIKELVFYNKKQVYQLIKRSDYNQAAKVLKIKPLPTLKKDEAVWVVPSNGLLTREEDQPKTIQVNGTSLSIQKKNVPSVLSSYSLPLVVSDTTYGKLQQTIKEKPTLHIGYFIPEWKRNFPDPVAVKMGTVLENKLDMPMGSIFNVGAAFYVEMKQGLSATLFVGLFIAVIFFICAGSFLYFRLFADQERDQQHYRAISRIGLTEREMKRSVTIQIALLFFLPFLVAVIHTSMALPCLFNVFSASVLKITFWTIIPFFILQLVYFLVVRARYIRNLKRAMVS